MQEVLNSPPLRNLHKAQWNTHESSTFLATLWKHLDEKHSEYAEILHFISECWSGRIEKLLECAKRLQRTPKLLLDMNYLLPARMRIFCRHDIPEVDFVVLLHQNDGHIHPVSTVATYRSSSLKFPSSRQLRLVLENGDFLREIEHVEGFEAPFVMELLQLELDIVEDRHVRMKCVKCLRTLNKRHNALPPSLFLHNITREGHHAVWGGGFADVWKGRMNGQLVCLKVLRFYTSSSDQKKLFKELSDEVLIWRQLRHPNILQFYGVNTDHFQPSYCIVSPWMPKGDVGAYLREAPDSTLSHRLELIRQIVDGLAYLHDLEPPVVHGDLKGSNVLMASAEHCCLADFGLSVLGTETYNLTSSTNNRGSLRWLAPELISPDAVPSSKRYSTARDIYAFACTVIEILTGEPPFANDKNEVAVMIKVLKGVRPHRPGICTDEMWSLIESCWDERASKRPSARQILCSAVFGPGANLFQTDVQMLTRSPSGSFEDITSKDIVPASLPSSSQSKSNAVVPRLYHKLRKSLNNVPRLRFSVTVERSQTSDKSSLFASPLPQDSGHAHRPSVNASRRQSTGEEQQIFYETAMMAKVQSDANGAGPSSTAITPTTAPVQSQDSSHWMSAEEEKLRLYNNAQAAVMRTQNRNVYSPPPQTETPFGSNSESGNRCHIPSRQGSSPTHGFHRVSSRSSDVGSFVHLSRPSSLASLEISYTSSPTPECESSVEYPTRSPSLLSSDEDVVPSEDGDLTDDSQPCRDSAGQAMSQELIPALSMQPATQFEPSRGRGVILRPLARDSSSPSRSRSPSNQSSGSESSMRSQLSTHTRFSRSQDEPLIPAQPSQHHRQRHSPSTGGERRYERQLYIANPDTESSASRSRSRSWSPRSHNRRSTSISSRSPRRALSPAIQPVPPTSPQDKRAKYTASNSDSDDDEYAFAEGHNVGAGEVTGKSADGKGKVARLPGACTHCMKLKMNCDFPEDDYTCKRCKSGGHVCIVQGRKPRCAPNRSRSPFTEVSDYASHDGAYLPGGRGALDRHMRKFRDIIDRERADFVREREVEAAERRRLQSELDAARDVLDAERDSRMTEMEEQLGNLCSDDFMTQELLKLHTDALKRVVDELARLRADLDVLAVPPPPPGRITRRAARTRIRRGIRNASLWEDVELQRALKEYRDRQPD